VRNKFIKLILVFFLFISFFSFNRFIFFPFVYEKLFLFEMNKNVMSSQSFFEVGSDDRIGEIYHKLTFMFENKLSNRVKKNINLGDRNFYRFKNDAHNFNTDYENRKMSWVYFSKYETIEALDILLNNGLTSLEIISFLKYKLGFPFFIKDELNILWDIIVNKKVFLNTLIKLDRGSPISFRFSNSKYRDMNQKYLLLIVDLAEREKFKFNLKISRRVPNWYLDLAKSLSEASDFLSIQTLN
jgi:hypothetical protein